LDQILFVESKNWINPVGSAEVAGFDWKIRLSGYSQGFLVVANGVTGRADDKTAAWNILWQANMEGRRLIVLTPTEMIACENTQSVRKLIRSKLRLLAVSHCTALTRARQAGRPYATCARGRTVPSARSGSGVPASRTVGPTRTMPARPAIAPRLYPLRLALGEQIELGRSPCAVKRIISRVPT
jgi:hypothetical protein